MPEVINNYPVMFRAKRSGESKGDITAVFPTEPADYAGRYFTVYAHIGQHGSASHEWFNSTRAAKPDEYAPLLAELRRIYESSVGEGDPVIYLKVVQRRTAAMRREFESAVQRHLRSLREDPAGGPWSPTAIADASAAMQQRGI